VAAAGYDERGVRRRSNWGFTGPMVVAGAVTPGVLQQLEERILGRIREELRNASTGEGPAGGVANEGGTSVDQSLSGGDIGATTTASRKEERGTAGPSGGEEGLV